MINMLDNLCDHSMRNISALFTPFFSSVFIPLKTTTTDKVPKKQIVSPLLAKFAPSPSVFRASLIITICSISLYSSFCSELNSSSI